ncbi:hypothetical protein G7Y89_g2392 [Cudoniella acicularis]|uniref:Uncharacterized protein n=1 Tax=Cudoniella acicularis TaxID=354080 RepID=A0A8H4RWE0_9HELO|nr:hypothetical protein G7Y89_g2392 [Cudoniella acicularis]
MRSSRIPVPIRASKVCPLPPPPTNMDRTQRSIELHISRVSGRQPANLIGGPKPKPTTKKMTQLSVPMPSPILRPILKQAGHPSGSQKRVTWGADVKCGPLLKPSKAGLERDRNPIKCPYCRHNISLGDIPNPLEGLSDFMLEELSDDVVFQLIHAATLTRRCDECILDEEAF